MYKVGKCKHGLRGNKEVDGQKCTSQHPKKCQKYCSFGTNKYGCKKGDNCTYYHPVLCKFSVQKRLCTNKDCTFIHLKGTKRKEPAVNSSNETKSQVKSSVKVKSRPQNTSAETTSTDNHFLELKRIVETMQSNFQQEIACIKANLHVKPQFPFYSPSNIMMNAPPTYPYHPTAQKPMTFIPQSLC